MQALTNFQRVNLLLWMWAVVIWGTVAANGCGKQSPPAAMPLKGLVEESADLRATRWLDEIEHLPETATGITAEEGTRVLTHGRLTDWRKLTWPAQIALCRHSARARHPELSEADVWARASIYHAAIHFAAVQHELGKGGNTEILDSLAIAEELASGK